jgi:hypothetical protein
VRGFPGGFGSSVGISVHESSNCGDKYPDAGLSFLSGTCSIRGTDSWSAGCSYGNFLLIHYPLSRECYGSAYVYEIAQGCFLVPPHWDNFPLLNLTGEYVRTQCLAPCFHVDSEIESPVTGEPMTLASLRSGAHPECHVPHERQADGVRIMSSCSDKPLRLTNDHLVFTPAGTVEAITLRAGDVLYKDALKSKTCKVLSTEREFGQDYFALNCQHSRVMADGVYTSTFGGKHVLPELWMTYMSKVLGVQRASAWGDKLVSFLSYVGLH